LILCMACCLFSACKNKKSVWPQIERDGFIKNCKKNAIEAGSSQLIAQSYCECMLDKMETLHPDIKDAGKLTVEEINEIAMKYRGECLEEH
jgi:hypothetical protein